MALLLTLPAACPPAASLRRSVRSRCSASLAPERRAVSLRTPAPQQLQQRLSLRRSRTHRALASPRAEAGETPEGKPGFGYTRADAIAICVGLPLVGFAGQAALTASGMTDAAAGNVILVVLVGGLTVAWTLTYVARVVNKDMTYVKQLDAYEEAVMAKRLEELPETELAALMKDVDEEKVRRDSKGPLAKP